MNIYFDKNQQAILKFINSYQPKDADSICQNCKLTIRQLNNHLKYFKANGVPIAENSSGYRLDSQSCLLDTTRIKQNLTALIDDIKIANTTTSTNNYLLKNAKGLAVLLAENQTNGLGRMGNTWHSSAYSNICLSLGMPIAKNSPYLSIFSLIIAVAVAKVIENYGVTVKLKWPNDIFVSDKKLGGILLQSRNFDKNNLYIVIGIGLNVHQQQITTDATDYISILDFCDKQPKQLFDRNLLAANLIDSCYWLLNNNFTTEHYLASWQQRALYLNKTVQIFDKDTGKLVEQGQFCGIAKTGALQLLLPNNHIVEFNSSAYGLRIDK